MIIAVTNGKMTVRCSSREDSLTASVFGMLRYLPSSIISDFLATAINNLDQTLEIPELDFEFRFWPYFHRPIGCDFDVEPDVIVSTNGHIYVIEAKLSSGKSGSGYDKENNGIKDQLVREYLLKQELSSVCQVDIEDIDFNLIYLTNDYFQSKEDLTESKSAADIIPSIDTADFERNSFRMNWSDLIPILKDFIQENDVDDKCKLIASDINRYLNYLGIAHFGGFADVVSDDFLPLINMAMDKDFMFFPYENKRWDWPRSEYGLLIQFQRTKEEGETLWLK